MTVGKSFKLSRKDYIGYIKKETGITSIGNFIDVKKTAMDLYLSKYY